MNGQADVGYRFLTVFIFELKHCFDRAVLSLAPPLPCAMASPSHTNMHLAIRASWIMLTEPAQSFFLATSKELVLLDGRI